MEPNPYRPPEFPGEKAPERVPNNSARTMIALGIFTLLMLLSGLNFLFYILSTRR